MELGLVAPLGGPGCFTALGQLSSWRHGYLHAEDAGIWDDIAVPCHPTVVVPLGCLCPKTPASGGGF